MYRFTTPTRTLTVEGQDLTGCDVVVSYRQRMGNSMIDNAVDIDDATVTYDGSDSTITVGLTQLQTAGFVAGKRCMVQVNWINSSGVRKATDVAYVPVSDNLYEEEMTYGG